MKIQVIVSMCRWRGLWVGTCARWPGFVVEGLTVEELRAGFGKGLAVARLPLDTEIDAAFFYPHDTRTYDERGRRQANSPPRPAPVLVPFPTREAIEAANS